MSAQQQRHALAVKEVQRWKVERLSTAEKMRRLNIYANDKRHLDYVPHLITACRELEVVDFARVN